MYTQQKTDWRVADKITNTELNRIGNNIDAVRNKFIEWSGTTVYQEILYTGIAPPQVKLDYPLGKLEIELPANTRLYLRRVRFRHPEASVSGPYTNISAGQTEWNSTSMGDDVAPDTLLYDNYASTSSTFVTVSFLVRGVYMVVPFTGLYAKMEIV